MYWGLEDVDFINVIPQEVIDAATAELARRLGKDIYPASPERIMLLTLLDLILLDREKINDTGKMNLLAYSRGDFLDHKGAFMDEVRLPAKAAKTMLKFKMSTALNYVNVIPKGTRVKSQNNLVFKTLEELEIPAGETEITAQAECETIGIAGNGIAKGSINIIVDVFPYYQSVENVTVSSGGAERETDDRFRERIHESPEKMTTAGPDGAYLYHTKAVNQNIIDAAVHSPSPGVVDVIPLMTGGQLPNDEIIKDIKDKLNDRKVRPLTDKVQIRKPTIVEYDLDLKYYISTEDKYFTSEIIKKVDQVIEDYVDWQKEKLGRDINPDKLIEQMVNAGAKRVEIVSPKFKVLNYDEVAHLSGTKSIKFMGVEDE